MAVVTPTKRPKSVRNRCVIEVFGGVCVLSRWFLEFSVGVGAFVIRMSQISSFFSLCSRYLRHIYCVPVVLLRSKTQFILTLNRWDVWNLTFGGQKYDTHPETLEVNDIISTHSSHIARWDSEQGSDACGDWAWQPLMLTTMSNHELCSDDIIVQRLYRWWSGLVPSYQPC